MYNPNIYSECSFKSLQAHSNGVIRENVKSLCIAIVGKKKNGIDVIVYSQQKWNKKGLRLKIMRFIFFVVHKKESICQNTSLLWTQCSRNFHNVKLRLAFVEIWSFNHLFDYTWKTNFGEFEQSKNVIYSNFRDSEFSF